MPIRKSSTHTYKRPLLYTVVYSSSYSLVATVVLLLSFCLQSVELAYANTDEVENPTVETTQITDEIIDRIEDTELPTPLVLEGEITEDEVPASDEVHTTVAEEIPITIPFDVPSEEITGPPVLTDSLPVTDTPQDAIESAPSGDFVGDTNQEESDSIVDDSQQESDQTTSIVDSATSTIEIPAAQDGAFTIESDAMIQFEKNNCLAVADGSYYCQAASSSVPQDDGLYALPDIDGDLEIYLKRDGDLIQITFNLVDDASPHYDPASDSIVWHRFANERYQIITYDVASGEEVQLTNTTANNMEPHRLDNYITWQYWSGGAWQIMLYDGSEILQLTDTEEHNLAPTIRNGLVVWHRIVQGQQSIEIYDIDSASYMTINDTEGGMISNPRMVLVYDAALSNGDVVTRGYNLATGEIDSFSHTPAPLPEELPDPDATGETRALLQVKSTSEEEVESTDIDFDFDSLATSTDELSAGATPIVATSTDLTLDLRVEIVDVPVIDTTPIPDLVVTDYASSSQSEDTMVE